MSVTQKCQNGDLYYFPAERQDVIFAVGDDGSWLITPDEWVGQTLEAVDIPEGCVDTERGFGQAWRQHRLVGIVGYAVEGEHPFEGSFEEYEGGYRLRVDGKLVELKRRVEPEPEPPVESFPSESESEPVAEPELRPTPYPAPGLLRAPERVTLPSGVRRDLAFCVGIEPWANDTMRVHWAFGYGELVEVVAGDDARELAAYWDMVSAALPLEG